MIISSAPSKSTSVMAKWHENPKLKNASDNTVSGTTKKIAQCLFKNMLGCFKQSGSAAPQIQRQTTTEAKKPTTMAVSEKAKLKPEYENEIDVDEYIEEISKPKFTNPIDVDDWVALMESEETQSTTDEYKVSEQNAVKILKNKKSVRMSFEIPTDPNQKDSRGITPLIYACKRNNLQQVKVLLNAGANPNIKDAKGFEPLYYAFKKNNYELAKILEAGGATLDMTEPDGYEIFIWLFQKEFPVPNRPTRGPQQT